MWVYDTETLRFLDGNDPPIAHYGYSRDEFLGMRISDIRPPEDVERLLADVARSRPAFRRAGEWRPRLRDGRLIDVEITSHQFEFDKRPAALVVVHDITERKQTARALAQSEARKAAIL